MATTWDVLDDAVRILVGCGPVKQRLIEAWRDHLSPLHDKDLPDTLRPRLQNLRAAMHSAHATGGMTAPEVSVRKMSETEAADHAVRILEMYAQVVGGEGEAVGAPRLRVVGAAHDSDPGDLPAFLSRA